jgi:hypothetical protein
LELAVSEPIIITSDDPILERLDFKPYRSTVVRRVKPFLPEPDEPQTLQLTTPWGSKLTAKKGDLLLSEVDAPDDRWPVDAKIFDETYVITEPGLCIKRATTLLVPLTDVTDGDKDRMVTIHTLEGPITVRAGDFFLAKGVEGEIWAYPVEKVKTSMSLAG